MSEASARPVKVAPSVLLCDYGRLADEIASVEAAGADLLHLDVMDGRFVPNITYGMPIVEAIRKSTRLPLNTHLMIVDPGRFVREFADLGSDIITVHVEACLHLDKTLRDIRECGAKAGVAISPATPVCAIEEVLPLIDAVVVMSVNPGFGGQKFIEGAVDKTRRVAKMVAGMPVEIEVDGGVSVETAKRVWDAGATVLVAGSAVFRRPDRKAAIEDLRRAAIAGL
ncbi:MAG: ribulose-phosphate 3-epimerase [Firmicutes bacterium]|nr:ribulose-phosphate 3-epimerase [Bacillota bacterium]